MNNPDTIDRQMLADSVRKWAAGSSRAADRAAASAQPPGSLAARWSEFADMGWLGVATAEADGGLGGSLADACVVAEELGRALIEEPFVPAVVLGGMLLADVAGGALRARWLPALVDGSRRVAFAPWEPGAPGRIERVETAAVQQRDAWLLHGDKTLAPGAAGADGCIVIARTGAQALGLFLVDAAAPGLQLQPLRLYDGRHGATLALRGAAAELLLEGPDADILACAQRALDRALVAHCAETAGSMAAAFDITRDYLTTRRQFGRTIASNQVVQHRLVDLYVEIEEVKALWQAGALAPAPRLVAALAARTTEVARHVWEETLQLHGAIGMTEEYVLGAYVRRLAMASSQWGTPHRHLARLAALSLGETE